MHMLNSNPMWWYLELSLLWEVIALMVGLTPYKRDLRVSSSLLPCEIIGKDGPLRDKKQALTRHWNCWPHDLGLASLQNWEVNVCCLSHSVYGVLLWHLEQIKTSFSSMIPTKCWERDRRKEWERHLKVLLCWLWRWRRRPRAKESCGVQAGTSEKGILLWVLPEHSPAGPFYASHHHNCKVMDLWGLKSPKLCLFVTAPKF